MDVFSHGLWAGAATKALNLKLKKKNKKLLSFRRAVIWGMLPDVFSFAPVFFWLFYQSFTKGLSPASYPEAVPDANEPMALRDGLPIFRLTAYFYNFSHSLIIFFLAFALVYLIFRRPAFEMGGWLLHVLIDIPTHSYRFYPTPFLWPVSGWKFNGFSWGQPWFIVLNYALLATVYYLLRRRKNKKIGMDT